MHDTIKHQNVTFIPECSIKHNIHYGDDAPYALYHAQDITRIVLYILLNL